MTHYPYTPGQAHTSYSNGCRCVYCTRGHATYRRWQREQANSKPVSPAEPLSLFDAPQAHPEGDASGYVISSRPAEPIDRLTQPRTGFHHRGASETERAAAAKQTQLAGRRLEVMAAIAAAPNGLTRHEVTQVSGVVLQSVCGRVAELLEAGFVRESGKRQVRAVLYATDRGLSALGRLKVSA